jgi:YjjG family noncanonical pyrimidine nucleotidase
MRCDLLFDLDQTLLDFHASEKLALKDVLEAQGLEFSQQRYDAFKQINKSLWLEFEKGEITKLQLFETRFRRLFELCGCDVESMDLAKINSDFIDAMAKSGVLMDGALELLERLTKDIADVRIYIVTNGVTRNALGRIASTGLDRFISEVFVSEEIGAAKPAREYFDAVVNAVGGDRESFLVIGDSLTSDMLGAKNAGLYSVWTMPQGDVESAAAKYGIGACVRSFDELYDVIEKWSAENEI